MVLPRATLFLWWVAANVVGPYQKPLPTCAQKIFFTFFENDNMNNGTVRLEEARKFIRANWKVMTDAQLADELDMNIVSIRRLRYRLGLIRNNRTVQSKV